MIEAEGSPLSNVTQFPAQPKKPPARRKSAVHGVRRSGPDLWIRNPLPPAEEISRVSSALENMPSRSDQVVFGSAVGNRSPSQHE